MNAHDRHRLLLFGAGGFGREIANWCERASWNGRSFELLGLIDDHLAGGTANGSPVYSLADAAERFPGAYVLATVGNPALRERLIGKALEAGLQPTPPVIHPNADWDPETVGLGEGVVICAGSILTVNIVVSAHAQINLDCTVGHDATVGRYCTLSPGTHISGNVILEERVFMGTGAVTVNGVAGTPLVLGADAVVGAGAVVTRNLEPGVTVVGVPARPLKSPVDD
jgi:sugar O-acyltransferase (sialic acid O-acetyltransferase NeuD family)